MNDKVSIRIKNRIESSSEGSLFLLDDFIGCGSPEAIRVALMRLCNKGNIIRIAQGIYFYPKIDEKWNNGIIHPSIEEIAAKIAERDRARIIPAEDFALHMLGLTYQIPVNIVFLTDGSQRKINLGKDRSILFKHTSEMRLFSFQSHIMLMIVMSMRAIGEANITKQQLDIIKKHLDHIPEHEFQSDIKLAPIWIRKILCNHSSSQI